MKGGGGEVMVDEGGVLTGDSIESFKMMLLL